jgi:hypothetical protein
MKRKINNKTYNTETAVFINRMVVQRRCTKVIVTVYKKRNGEYFLYCVSFPNTYFTALDFLTEKDYVNPEHYAHLIGEFIIPLEDEEDIEYWLN